MSDRCANCGEYSLNERIAAMEHEVAGRVILIEDDLHTFCGSCGHVSYVGSQISEMEIRVARKIREQDGLLMPEELKAVRNKYGLTQSEMEDLLSIGKKTWIRWERGKVVQSKAVDTLIRAMAAHPAIVRDLLSQKGVVSNSASQVLDAIDAETELSLIRSVNAMIGNKVSPDLLAEIVHTIVSSWRKRQADTMSTRRIAI